MTISHDSSKPSCFSSILRSLICSNGIPTHPSSDTDNNPNVEQIKVLQPPPALAPAPAPAPAPANIVARLMGLDSLPNSLHTSKSSLGSLMRKSRSVGSLDFIQNFDITKQPHHRRLRTSVSYREDVTTTTLLQTSHNHDDQISRKPKSTGLTPIQEKPNILNKNHRRQCQKVKVHNSKKQVSSLPKKITKKKLVVDDGFPEKKNKLKSRSRRCNHPLPKATKKKVVDDKESKMSILKRRKSDQEYCIKVLMEVGRLTMEEIQGNGDWVERTMVNDREEISYEIGHDILQLLVYEMVDELCISM